MMAMFSLSLRFGPAQKRRRERRAGGSSGQRAGELASCQWAASHGLHFRDEGFVGD